MTQQYLVIRKDEINGKPFDNAILRIFDSGIIWEIEHKDDYSGFIVSNNTAANSVDIGNFFDAVDFVKKQLLQ